MAPPSMIEVPEAGTGRTPLAGPGGRIVKENVPKSDAVAVNTPVMVSPGASLPHSPNVGVSIAVGAWLLTRTVTTLLWTSGLGASYRSTRRS